MTDWTPVLAVEARDGTRVLTCRLCARGGEYHVRITETAGGSEVRAQALGASPALAHAAALRYAREAGMSEVLLRRALGMDITREDDQ